MHYSPIQQPRWGIWSTGKMAKTFAKNMNHLDPKWLYAVGSRSIEKAQNFQKEFGAKKAYEGLDELLKDENIDIIYIATPHMFHYSEAKKAIKAGKHVLCEKAFTMDTKQAIEIVKLAKEKKVFLMEAVWTRFHPAFQQMQAWLKDNHIGKIRMAKMDFIIEKKFDPSHRLFKKELGGGALLDLGVYCLHVAQSIMGNPSQIISHAVMNEENVDHLASGILQYEQSSAISHMSFGFGPPMDRSAYIMGEKGYIHLEAPFHSSQKIHLTIDGKEPQSLSFPFENDGLGYIYEIQAVHEALGKGWIEHPLMSHQDTIDIMKQMDHMRESWGLSYHML